MSGSSSCVELANDATRKAYEASPTNRFVIETYVKNLLENALASSELAVEHCIEALGILFSALNSSEEAYRKPELGALADDALQILLQQAPVNAQYIEPASAIDVLTKAWSMLAQGRD